VYNVINFEIERQMGMEVAGIYLPATRKRYIFDQQLTALFSNCILAFVIDEVTTKSVHITQFTATDPLKNFLTFPHDMGITIKFTRETGNRMTTVDAEWRTLAVTMNRSVFAQSFTACVLLMN
jgi:hypothetical protein